MFAAVVREGMLVRLPSGRIAAVLWAVPREPGFFDVQYVDNDEKGTVHCRLMRPTVQPRDMAGPVIPQRSSWRLDE